MNRLSNILGAFLDGFFNGLAMMALIAVIVLGVTLFWRAMAQHRRRP